MFPSVRKTSCVTSTDEKLRRQDVKCEASIVTLWASSTTNTLPVCTSARTKRRETISNRPQADEGSIKGSERSMIVSCPAANRLLDDFGFGFLSINELSIDKRCSKPDNWAGLNFFFCSSSSLTNARYVYFSPSVRRIVYQS